MLTFTEYIEKSIKKHWELDALSNYKENTLQYKDVAVQIKKIHYLFNKLQIEQQDKVVVVGKNNANWVVTFLSTITYGAVSVPLLQDFKPEDIENTVNHSDATLVFLSENIFKNIHPKQFPNIKAFISLESFEVLEATEPHAKEYVKEAKELDLGLTPETFSIKNIPQDQLATISYTSGTSGHSKGVMLSHKNYATNIEFAHSEIPFEPGDEMVSFLPLAHAYGLAFEVLAQFTSGCHITFLGRIPSPNIILQALKEKKPCLIVVVPLILEKIYKNKLKPEISKGLPRIMLGIPGLRKIVHKKLREQLSEAFGGNFHEVIIGGAALNKEVESFLHKIKFPYTVGYGMTECAPIITYAPSSVVQKFSCGYPIKRCEVKIDSPDPENIAGEIMVKGSQVMLGYYKNEEETEKTFEDGWLKTGDLGVKNKAGYVTIKGRNKNMILSASGQNIYPEEIESRINNIPYVMESLVVEKEGKLHALIVPDLEKAEKDGINKEQVIEDIEKEKQELNKKMPNYMAISKVEIRNEEFTKTPKKSIKRYLYTN